MSPEDRAYLARITQSVREHEDRRTTGERACLVLLAAIMGMLGLLLLVRATQGLAWVEVSEWHLGSPPASHATPVAPLP